MDYIKVAAAIIVKDDKILIARRKQGKHLEFKWEFPGGKIEEGESEQGALSRELMEEFGIKVKVQRFVTESFYTYEKVKVNLRAYLVRYLEGEFNPVDHDEIKWISILDQKQYDFAPADIPINDHLLKYGIQIN